MYSNGRMVEMGVKSVLRPFFLYCVSFSPENIRFPPQVYRHLTTPDDVEIVSVPILYL